MDHGTRVGERAFAPPRDDAPAVSDEAERIDDRVGRAGRLDHHVCAAALRELPDARAAERNAVMAGLSARYGLFYFFAQTCGACEVMSPIVKAVADRWRLTVRAISTDGGPSRHFPHYRVENGERPKMGLEPAITPALVLWDSRAGRAIPIGYGVLSADEL